MIESFGRNRRIKRVDDDESMSEQPIQKSARREDESIAAPSENELDIELEKRLVELSALLDEARRKAETAINNELKLVSDNDYLKIEMARIRRRLEVVNDMMDHSTRQNNSLRIKNEGLERSMESANGRIEELSRENVVLKEDLEAAKRDEEIAKKINFELTRDNSVLKENLNIFDARRNEEIAKNMNFDLAAKNFTLQRELDEARERETESNALRERKDARINELELKVAQYERPKKIQTVDCPFTVKLSYNCDTSNIFQPCYQKAAGTIKMRNAIRMLRPKIRKCGEKYWEKYEDLSGNNLNCVVCHIAKIKKKKVMAHFFSSRHYKNTRAHNAAVSYPAVLFWQRQLDIASGSLYVCTEEDLADHQKTHGRMPAYYESDDDDITSEEELEYDSDGKAIIYEEESDCE